MEQRLIDANALEERFSVSCGGECALCSYNNTLCDIITEAPTVDAIPRERIEQMIAEIETELETLRAINTEQNKASDYYMNFEIANMSGMIGGYVKTLDIIHKYTKEQTNGGD